MTVKVWTAAEKCLGEPGVLKEGANSEVCDALSLGLLKLEVPTGRGVKVHERTSVFSAALASAQCSPAPHPGNSLLKILSKVQTPASELDLFASLSTFFFPAREDHYQLLCQLVLPSTQREVECGWESRYGLLLFCRLVAHSAPL